MAKVCSYCGRENTDSATRCAQCGCEFPSPQTLNPALTDPGAALRVVATFGDLIHATLLRDELQAAGISALIPEELATSPFGGIFGLARFTVRVAARDYDTARQTLAELNLPHSDTDDSNRDRE